MTDKVTIKVLRKVEQEVTIPLPLYSVREGDNDYAADETEECTVFSKYCVDGQVVRISRSIYDGRTEWCFAASRWDTEDGKEKLLRVYEAENSWEEVIPDGGGMYDMRDALKYLLENI